MIYIAKKDSRIRRFFDNCRTPIGFSEATMSRRGGQVDNRERDAERGRRRKTELVPVVCAGFTVENIASICSLVGVFPGDCGLAFVIVQNMNLTRQDGLIELLSGHTEMRVLPVRKNVSLRANYIYVMPPGQFFVIKSGRFENLPVAEGHIETPFDVFLTALAASHGKNGIGIALSGRVSETIAGLHALKAAGGLIIAQNSRNASQDSIPNQFANLAYPDIMLRIDEIPDVLRRYAKQFSVTRPESSPCPEGELLLGESVAPALVGAKGTELDNNGYAELIKSQPQITHRQMEALIGASPAACCALDRQGRIRFMSGAMAELFGYDGAELLGQPIAMLIPPELRARHEEDLRNFLKEPVRRPLASGLEICGLGRDGTLIPLDVGLGPMETADGPLVLVVVHDLRKIKKVAEDLQAARLAAERANAIKTQFLWAAGHDLRQPLQTIGLLKAVLERQVVNPHAYATLVKLGSAASHMQELVDSLLDASLIESGAVRTELESVALGPLLARIMKDFEPAAAAKGLELRYVSSSVIIRGDRLLLTRIFGNLLSNAIKYTNKGKILLGCRRRGGELFLEVWDTGIGIHPENIEVIFGEFQRGENEWAERKGLGLGLFIVQHFAGLLECRVEVCSKPGRGSMFALAVPDHMLIPATGLAAARAEAGAGEPCVLLVESDSEQLDALDSLLQMEGYVVLAARDGEGAMAHLSRVPLDAPLVIVASYALSGGADGVTLIRQVCAALNRQIPALVLNNRDPGPAEIERAGGGCQFVAKPVNPDYLLGAVENSVRLFKPNWRGLVRKKQYLTMNLPTQHTPDAEVAVIDDDAGICDAVCAILEPGGYKVEAFSSAEDYLADPLHGRFKCLLVDISLPGLSGMELLAQLNMLPERPQVIFLSGNTDVSASVKALQEGAADFLRKPVQGTALLQSVANVLRYGREMMAGSVQQTDIATRLARLTAREREVMVRVIKGELNKNIASDLGISERTTEHHRQSAMRKMGVKSLAMLVQTMLAWKGN